MFNNDLANLNISRIAMPNNKQLTSWQDKISNARSKPVAIMFVDIIPTI